MNVSAASVDWQSSGNFERLILTVGTPSGAVISREFTGNRASFRAQDMMPRLPEEGTYTYTLRAVPKISSSVKSELAAARAADDDTAIARIRATAGIGEEVVQSGAFTILNGSFITDRQEPPMMGGPSKLSAVPTSAPPLKGAPNDVVTADDEIIQGSLCVGLDCVVNENFGFDTIRLKENNTRIKFDDTSTSAGFPNNDWQLTANDSASGGLNKFSIDDVTNSKTPFTVVANAPTNSLFVASTGKVGFGNSSPVLNLHITATDTPAIRQEQTSGGGFTAQTWDIGANEANWFVRDVTGGSRLPLRIRPGAPTSSIDISNVGNVGIGTASPSAKVDVVGTGGLNVDLKVNGRISTGDAANQGGMWLDSGNTKFVGQQSASNFGFYSGSWRFIVDGSNGNVGVGTTSPTSKLQVVGLPVYANNAAAVAGGLSAGAFYRTGGDPDLVAVVHYS